MRKFGVEMVILKITEGSLDLLDRITGVVSVVYVVLRWERGYVETSRMCCGIVSIR